MIDFEKNPNPTKDQHFMVDEKMLERICRKAGIQQNECIIEIGGGSGNLTEYLAKTQSLLTVVEKDPYYANILREKFKSFENVTVVEDDALNLTYSQYDRIIANLPYTITEPFLISLARSGALYTGKKNDNKSKLKSVTLVVSQNSTRKMVAPIQIVDGNSKHLNQEFGFISTICNCLTNVDIDTVIPSTSFFPEPAVTSFLINLTLKKKMTTVDRIVGEMLLDRKGTAPSIDKIYQLMLSQGKSYKLEKHKGRMNDIPSKVTSKEIGQKNIYDLSNEQLSQLLKDLIKNDNVMKSRTSRVRNFEIGGSMYSIKNGKYDFDDEFDDNEEKKNIKTKAQKRSEQTYEYLYDEKRYNVLLNRGLEFVEMSELENLLKPNQIVV